MCILGDRGFFFFLGVLGLSEIGDFEELDGVIDG